MNDINVEVMERFESNSQEIHAELDKHEPIVDTSEYWSCKCGWDYSYEYIGGSSAFMTHIKEAIGVYIG